MIVCRKTKIFFAQRKQYTTSYFKQGLVTKFQQIPIILVQVITEDLPLANSISRV